MSQATTAPTTREPGLLGQTVVVIGGSSGIGLETARQVRAEGGEVIITGRNPERLAQAAEEVGALSTATLELGDPAQLDRFFADLPTPIDHILVSGGGPYYSPLATVDLAAARRSVDEHLLMPVFIARHARTKVRPGGSLLLISGTGARRPAVGLAVAAIGTAALPLLTQNLALEIAPVRVNLIAAGFVDTRLSARLLGDGLDARRDELRGKLPIGRVVGPEDVAAMAVHLMTNTALTGATFDVDGGEQIVGA